MSWKVSVERIKIFPHPNAENLVVARVGLFQLVVRKDTYVDGDYVVFAPKRSIIPECLRGNYLTATGASYLSPLPGDVYVDEEGKQIPCRVSSFPLRGVESEGVTIDSSYVAERFQSKNKTLEQMVESGDIKIGEDISQFLGITQYKAPIPKNLEGKLIQIPPAHIRKHDVESGIMFGEEFKEGEEVVMTEKVHGSQMAVLQTTDDNFYVSSKNLLADDFGILEDADNLYWKSIIVDNYFLRDFMKEKFHGVMVQIFAEVIPCQKKYGYGFTKEHPVYRIYRMEVNHQNLSKDEIVKRYPELKPYMVPELYRGPYDVKILRELANQKEQVSGKELHNSEGGVVEPVEPRKSSLGFDLYVKFLNKKFKGNDDDMS